MKTLLLASLFLSFAGCATTPESPVTDLAHASVHAYVFDDLQRTGNLGLTITRAGQPTDFETTQPNDCLRLSDSTTVTANGVGGAMGWPGGYSEDGWVDDQTGQYWKGCTGAQTELPITGRPSTIALVVTDGSTELDINLALDAKGKYEITRCDPTECSISPTASAAIAAHAPSASR
jgi:hypothetical protein